MTGHVTLWTQSGVLSHKKDESLSRLFLKELKPSAVVTLITKFHDMSTVTFPRQHNGLQALSVQEAKSEFFSL